MRDIVTNGLPISRLVRSFLFAAFREYLYRGVGYRACVAAYDWVQARRGGVPFPLHGGTLDKTPTALLDLKPGELVRVKSYADILATLGRDHKNRGLWFDPEMVRYCGGTYRVVKRVRRILDEKTGKMLEFSNPLHRPAGCLLSRGNDQIPALLSAQHLDLLA